MLGNDGSDLYPFLRWGRNTAYLLRTRRREDARGAMRDAVGLRFKIASRDRASSEVDQVSHLSVRACPRCVSLRAHLAEGIESFTIRLTVWLVRRLCTV